MRLWTLILFVACALSACKTTGSGASRSTVYLIKIEKGDTLASIATKYDTTWDKIASLNNLSPGQAPKIGSVIRVQPGPGGFVARSEGGLLSRRLPKRTKAEGGGNSNANGNGNEFQEEDLPEGEAATPSQHGGLLFGNGSASSRGRAGLEWPLFGEISSPYGRRGGKFHHGVDIHAKRGTAVMAAGSGIVEFAGRQHGYGKVVIIKHKNELRTLYGHLSSIDVSEGDTVTHGTEVGEVGTTGNASGPHLHFEIRNPKGQSIDPMTLIEKSKLLSSAH